MSSPGRAELLEKTGLRIDEPLISVTKDGMSRLVLLNENGVSYCVDDNTCIGVVHEVFLVNAGPQSVQAPDPSLVSRVETGTKLEDSCWETGTVI